MRARITAPAAGFNGAIGEVLFRGGVAETDSITVIRYCREAGYTVEPVDQVDDADPTPPADPDPDPPADPDPDPDPVDVEPAPAPRRRKAR